MRGVLWSHATPIRRSQKAALLDEVVRREFRNCYEHRESPISRVIDGLLPLLEGLGEGQVRGAQMGDFVPLSEFPHSDRIHVEGDMEWYTGKAFVD